MRKVVFPSYALAGFLLASSAAIAPPAAAEDYTFTVPVDVRGLAGQYIRGRVDCDVLSMVPPPAPGPLSGAATLSRGSAVFPLSDGGYRGNVTVKFNASVGQVANAKGYMCILVLVESGPKHERYAAEEPHRPGTPFTVDVRGALYP